MGKVDGDITALLRRVASGEASASEELAPKIYDELRSRAASYMRREGAGHLLQTTALVHEAWMSLGGPRQIPWEDRNHFFAAAARIMRHILIDIARKNAAIRNGGTLIQVQLDDNLGILPGRPGRFEALEAALSKLEKLYPRRGQVVEMRFYGGMTELQIAAVLGVSDRTIKRDWEKARAWLHQELSNENPRRMSQTGFS